MSAGAPPLPQSLLLGSIVVLIAATTDTAYALTASAVAPPLSRARGIRALGRGLTAAAFISLGVYTALTGPRSGKHT